ncbi:ABC transporter permease [Streptomyces sp. NPDC056500]|uniref:ABC transporter permease n=1 Tax=Streptomyces sp. NPDC056500 TaxID=3345840 RepID=UPI00367712A9
MTETAHSVLRPASGSTPPPRQRSALAALLLPVVMAVAIGSVFIGVYLSAFHAPVPRDLPVTVVGTAATAQTVQDRLDARSPGGFHIERTADTPAARAAVEHGDTFAAYLPHVPDTGSSGPQLLHAGAHGPAVSSVLLDAFGQLAEDDGRELKSTDLVPASADDTRGLSVFYTTFGLVLAGYLFGIMTFQLAPGISPARRLAGLAAFGGVGGVAVASIVAAFGALPAPFLGVAGLVALVALAVGASTMLLVRGWGVVGSSLAAVIFMTIGNATSGGSLPAEFLPDWLQPFSTALPVGVGVRAVNGLAYFHGDGVVSGVVILVLWTMAGVLGLLLVERARQRRRTG